jgi:hypothetical protein
MEKKLTIRLNPTTHKRFKIHCLYFNTSAQEVIGQYILALLDHNIDPQEAIKSLKTKEEE